MHCRDMQWQLEEASWGRKENSGGAEMPMKIDIVADCNGGAFGDSGMTPHRVHPMTPIPRVNFGHQAAPHQGITNFGSSLR